LNLNQLKTEIENCRICVERPLKTPLPHEPRPVVQLSTKAKLCISGQAPGVRVHKSGRPFTDPSGDRIRAWMNVSEEQFYDADRLAIIPMGFCFPGHDSKGGDLPPRKECAQHWHQRLFLESSQFESILAVGSYACKYHLPEKPTRSLTEMVADWRHYIDPRSDSTNPRPLIVPLPHPSWRNTGWLKKNPWFEQEYLPRLREIIHRYY
jgi:uracil-DNA glycosylase